ncbi:unnamed protein product [Effrenium voratum]|nr:unnamed protein product [Effrenium voratum]
MRVSRLTRAWADLRERLPRSGLQYIALEKLGDRRVPQLPQSIRILLEAALRRGGDSAEALLDFQRCAGKADIAWLPPRVLLQDLSGIPALVDLCAMRDAVQSRGGDPRRVQPLAPVDLVVDHSISVDVAGRKDALKRNMEIELQRNQQRFKFLKWAQQSFENFNLVPPGLGIVHQVHCESLARMVMRQEDLVFPDACIGTDSHTTMVNGLGLLGWGVGGLEVEAAMLGQPMSMRLPEVVGLELSGALRVGTTATDLVLTVTERLRAANVVGKLVEVFGPGAEALSVTDRLTVANMAPECGATCILFPLDEKTLDYLRFTGRQEQHVELVEEYYRSNGLFGAEAFQGVAYSEVVSLDLGHVEPCMAGPKRPQDRVPLTELKSSFRTALALPAPEGFGASEGEAHGQLAIAAITSCTNTSNPSVLMAAGLLAKKAVALGCEVPGYVKTSLAPGSKVVTSYLEAAGLLEPLEALGFHVVGYGCTTCMGNSGALHPEAQAASERGAVLAAVLSGNRNFEGRVHLAVKANYLASPPLVVAAALAGRIDVDFASEPLGRTSDGRAVYLKDLWPSFEEVEEAMLHVRTEMFTSVYSQEAGAAWAPDSEPSEGSVTYDWGESTFLTRPPLLDRQPGPLRDAFCLLLLGDSVTTDHICPNSAILSGPAFDYLRSKGVEPKDMGSFGARRGNADVMVRGAFANPRILNKVVDRRGPWALHVPSGEEMHVFDAAQRYQEEGYDLVVIAGKEYGSGSSRDWAAKGPALLGVRAVLAESFERIHRANLVGMGILPLTFAGTIPELSGRERLRLHLPQELRPGAGVEVEAQGPEGHFRFTTTLRLDTEVEVEYFKCGGILPYVLQSML